VNRAGPIPYGPDRKDPPWRWGSFLIGVASFVALAWIATLGGINLFGFWWIIAVVLGVLFSMRAGRSSPWVEEAEAPSTAPLAAAVSRVRPREFGPVWWAVYSVVVRSPVALGDFVLTTGWRLSGGFWNGNGGRRSGSSVDQVDHAERMPAPDRRRF
jgi:hypothetical protein